jgi:Putative DNA-binding domain
MRDFYDELLSGGEAVIARLVSERQQEDVSLEFKTKADPNTGALNRDDKRNLAKELCAFSNSMGGLIVWGVAARKDQDDVDCATEPKPIVNIERFKSDVKRLISQALMPRHEGILVEAIPAAQPTGAGYLAIYVERSERRPHRAELGVGRYFKRIGDSSVPMEHYDIEDSFKRLVVPWLEVEWSARPYASNDSSRYRAVAIEIHLRNPSPVTARFPYLTLFRVRGARVEEQTLFNPYEAGRGYHKYDEEHHFFGGANDVVHPGLTLRVARLVTPEIPIEPREGAQCRIVRGSLQPVTTAYQCGCYNSRPAVGEFTVSDNELVDRGIVGAFIY